MFFFLFDFSQILPELWHNKTPYNAFSRILLSANESRQLLLWFFQDFFFLLAVFAFCVIACNLTFVCEVAAFFHPAMNTSRRDRADSYHLFPPFYASLGVMHVWTIARRKTRVNWKFDNSMALVGGFALGSWFMAASGAISSILLQTTWVYSHPTDCAITNLKVILRVSCMVVACWLTRPASKRFAKKSPRKNISSA